MSKPAATNRIALSGPAFSRWLLLLAGLAVVGPIVGWGLYSAFNQKVDAINEAESEDEIAFLEVPGESDDSFRRPTTATLTDVVTAVHQEIPGDGQPTIIQAAGQRPASNPSAWLAGTIEDSATESGPPRLSTPPNLSAPLRFSLDEYAPRQFTRSSTR